MATKDIKAILTNKKMVFRTGNIKEVRAIQTEFKTKIKGAKEKYRRKLTTDL